GGSVVTEKVGAFGYDHIFESLSKMSDTGNPPRAFLRSTNNYSVPDVDERFEFGSWDTIDGMSLLNVNDGKYSTQTLTEKFPTSFEVLGMARSAEKTEAFRQYVHKLNNSENIPGDALYLQLYSWVGETHYIDWARVRKYTSTEPTLTFISEKTTSDWKLFAGAIIVTVLIVAIILQKRSTRKNNKNDIPDILLSITSSKGFKVGTWEKLDVNISNVGNGIAKDIEVKLLGPIETSGNKTVEILKGKDNQTSIVMGVKPKEHGNIPLKVEIIFFDQRGKRYELKEEVFVSVAKESETISHQQIPIINIGSIGKYVGEHVDKSTHITDSIVQHSTIGAGARKCTECGKEVKANATFCPECGTEIGG
ncbi:MAG: zinc ribbon domain-containing protein, partial [archaeon]